ncbi:MAG: hypothetical protein ACJ714_01455 [Ornithinibacter sp.]
MPRPYSDPIEVLTAPVPARSPFIPVDAKIVLGTLGATTSDPIVLLPSFEYRISEWRHPETRQTHWRLERRRAGTGNGPAE